MCTGDMQENIPISTKYTVQWSTNLAQREVWLLPSALGRWSLSTGHVLPDKSVFFYLEALGRTREFNNVIYGGAFRPCVSAWFPGVRGRMETKVSHVGAQPHLCDQAVIKALDTKVCVSLPGGQHSARTVTRHRRGDWVLSTTPLGEDSWEFVLETPLDSAPGISSLGWFYPVSFPCNKV